MNITKSTPAPWNHRISSNCPDVWEIVAGFCETPIAEVPCWQDEDGNASPEAEANVKAMTAAPALIAACRMVVERWESGDLAEAARLCQQALDLAADAGSSAEPEETDIHALLASRRQIAVIWSIEDVQEIRPDLGEGQAWKTLQAVRHDHNCNHGITWDSVDMAAATLFPEKDAE